MKLRQILSFALGAISVAMLGIMSLPIMSWIFSPEDIGKFSLFNTVLGLSVLIFSAGLDQSYIRNYNDSQNHDSLLKHTFFIPVIIFIVFSICIYSFQPRLISKIIFDTPSKLLSGLVIIAALAMLLTRFLSLVLRMKEQGIKYSISQVIPKIILLIFLLAYINLKSTHHFFYLLLASVISLIIGSLFLILLIKKNIISSFKVPFHFDKFKDEIIYGSPFILGGIAFWGLMSIDRILLKTYSTYSELGIYAIAVSFSSIGMILQSVFSTIWAPIVYKWSAQKRDLGKIDTIRDIMISIIVIIFSLCGAFSWIIDFILPHKYLIVKNIVIVCLASPLLYTLSEVTVIGLGILKKSGVIVLASCLALIVSILSNILLIPHFGASGAAISVGITFFIFFVLRTEFTCFYWQGYPRIKMYSKLSFCIILAIVTALYPSPNAYLFPLIWGSIGIIEIAISYKMIKQNLSVLMKK